MLARLGRTSAAEQEARRALELDADLPAAHRARAEILRRAGDLEGASRELDVVIAVERGAAIDDRLAHATVAAGRGACGRRPRASSRRWLEAAPRPAEVRFAAAFVALARDQARGRAARPPTPRSRCAPRYPEARLVRAEALARLGRDAEMRRELDRFLAEAPPRDGRGARPGRTNAARAIDRT